MDNKEKENIYYRFMNGESIKQIGDSLGMNWSSIYQIIGNRLPMNVELSNQDKEIIKEMYLSGISCPKIAERFKVCHKLIGIVLDEFGIDRKHNGVRKYKLKEDYFDNINTPNKAYILGFLYADGYNGLNKQTIRLQLSEVDREILEKIREEIGSDRPIKNVDCSSRIYGNNYSSKNMCTLEFYGSHICNALDIIGMHQNKSLILEYPSFLYDDLHRHFIRGYFDGDGSFNIWHNKQSIITITSTEQFCRECLRIIRLNANIGGNIYDASCHNGITKYISISGNVQCKKVLDWLYYDADLFLKRKYDQYVKYFYPSAA